ncbi:MAG TPA: GNAT family N-acetyltransferase [Abditibacteriaceae bacterium]|jgi:aminoglycoside 6'-N-acetyltransferase I
MQIVAIERQHLPTCATLFAAVFCAAPWNESWTSESALVRLQRCLDTPGSFGLMAQNEAELVAFALGYIEPWEATAHFYLKEMCVDVACQRKGIGKQLIAALERELQAQNVARIFLHTARESIAQSFYEKCGFYVSPRMIQMSKRLPSDSD